MQLADCSLWWMESEAKPYALRVSVRACVCGCGCLRICMPCLGVCRRSHGHNRPPRASCWSHSSRRRSSLECPRALFLSYALYTHLAQSMHFTLTTLFTLTMRRAPQSILFSLLKLANSYILQPFSFLNTSPPQGCQPALLFESTRRIFCPERSNSFHPRLLPSHHKSPLIDSDTAQLFQWS